MNFFKKGTMGYDWIQSAHEKGYAKGYKKGYREGLAAGKKQAKQRKLPRAKS